MEENNEPLRHVLNNVELVMGCHGTFKDYLGVWWEIQ